jgi:hypothetical protein
MFPVRYGQTYWVELCFKQKTGRRIMSRIMIVILIYHRHKPAYLNENIFYAPHRKHTKCCSVVQLCVHTYSCSRPLLLPVYATCNKCLCKENKRPTELHLAKPSWLACRTLAPAPCLHTTERYWQAMALHPHECVSAMEAVLAYIDPLRHLLTWKSREFPTESFHAG